MQSGSDKYAPGVEQRLREMQTGAQNVTTNPTVSDKQAKQPVQEFTEFIEKPTATQPTQYMTQQNVIHQEAAPIRLKEQEIRQVEQKTVVQEQPVIVKKQEVQVEKERPIEVVKHVTEHQTLPAQERKEVVIQPVQHTAETARTISETTTERGAPVQYNVTAEASTAEKIGSHPSSGHNVAMHIKESVGGVKTAAHGLLETAREKAREVFHRDDKTADMSNKSSMDPTLQQSSTTSSTSRTY